MSLGFSFDIGVFVFLGIAVIILIGYFSYSIASRKPLSKAPIEIAPKKEKDSPIMPINSITTQKDFPTPWFAKVTTGVSSSNSQPAIDEEPVASKHPKRPVPVVIMASGATERPSVKKGTSNSKPLSR